MKKILLFMVVLMVATCMVSCNSNTNKPTQAKMGKYAPTHKDTLQLFKAKALDGLTRYLKSNVSSDPDFGKVLKTEKHVLNDSLYFARAKVLIMNQYGAKQQYNDLYFAFAKGHDGKYYMIVWGNEDRCKNGLKHILGYDPGFIVLFEPEQPKLYNALCNNPNFELETFIDDF